MGGKKVACGVITPTAAEMVTMSRYPEYAGSVDGYSVGGLLAVSPTSSGVNITGVLTGLEAEKTARLEAEEAERAGVDLVRVHSGYGLGRIS